MTLEGQYERRQRRTDPRPGQGRPQRDKRPGAPAGPPSQQATRGLDPRNRPAPPQIAGQGPTPPYASQAPIGSAMPSFAAQAQNPYASAMVRSGFLNQTQIPPLRFPGTNVNRPQFTYGLNQNNPMWANAPQQGPGSPWDYYADVNPQQNWTLPGDVPRASGSTGWEGVHRQWNPNEINPRGIMQMMQDYGGQWPQGAMMNPLLWGNPGIQNTNPLMGR